MNGNVLFWLLGLCIITVNIVFLQISVDTLSWDFIVSTVDDSNLLYPPKVTPYAHIAISIKISINLPSDHFFWVISCHCHFPSHFSFLLKHWLCVGLHEERIFIQSSTQLCASLFPFLKSALKNILRSSSTIQISDIGGKCFNFSECCHIQISVFCTASLLLQLSSLALFPSF